MRVSGVVARVEEGYAWVDVSVAQGCGRCKEPGGCGGVNIARPWGPSGRTVRVANPIGVQPGEQVGLLIDEGVPLKAALAAYAWPVLGVLVGAALGTAVASPGGVDLSAGLGALAGGLVAALLGRWRGGGLSRGGELPLRLERAVSATGGCGR